MQIKHILSFSGGKDSTYLLLELIRRKYPLDEVVFFDTGWEFPVMYEHIEKCKRLCEDNGVKFVTLRPANTFDYEMLSRNVRKKNGETQSGFSWCGGLTRWGTTIKLQALDRYTERQENAIVYIGIAADETARLEKERAEYKRFPLAEWGITEAECLRGCYDAGFDWGGMYEHLDRLSCMYCRNKNLKELRNIRRYYPEVWECLKQRQTKTSHPLKSNMEYGNVFDLEKRFAFEEKRIKQGLSIKSKDFFSELKNILTQ